MARKPEDRKARIETPATDDAAPAATAPRFPLFYMTPRPLEASRHAKTTLAGNLDVGFSENANAIPLNIAACGRSRCRDSGRRLRFLSGRG